MELKAGLFSGDSGEESTFGLPQLIDRVHFLAAGGLRSPVPCWPSAGSPFSVPRGFLHPFATGFLADPLVASQLTSSRLVVGSLM